MTRPKYTKTSSFLFPLLGIKKTIFDCNVVDSFGRLLLNSRFINAYLEDSVLDGTDYNNGSYIMILINAYQDVNFESFYNTMLSYSNYVDDYEQNGQLVMIYKIPKEKEIDYEIILKGGYSRVSLSGKRLIMKNAFFHPAPALASILSKGVDLKHGWEKKLSNSKIDYAADLGDQEVWSSILIENERINDVVLKEIATYYNISVSKL